MKITLDKKQIEHISRFIKARGVNYDDVKAEMTDHIALEVEELMLQENITFLVAIKRVFLRYDRFHFMKIEEEKEKRLRKQSWKEFKTALFSFFTIPKILITALLLSCSKFLIEYMLFYYVMIGFMVLMVVVLIALFYFKRKWVGKGTYLQLQKYHWAIPLLTNLMIQITFNIAKPEQDISPWIGAAFATTTFLILYISAEIYTKELKRLKRQLV